MIISTIAENFIFRYFEMFLITGSYNCMIIDGFAK